MSKENAYIDWDRLTSLLLPSVLLFLLMLNCCLAVYAIFHKPLYPDELQHLHIAWNMFSEHKLIYADFWEHHGILFPFVNYLLFVVFSFGAHFDTFIIFRCIAFVYVCIIYFLTFKIAKLVFKSDALGLLAIAILSSCYYLLLNGIEIRPDQIQNIFWLGGIYILLKYIRSDKILPLFVAGLAFGFALLSNAKAIFGITAAVGVVVLRSLLVLLQHFQRKTLSTVAQRLTGLAAGIIAPTLAVWMFFFVQGELHAYFQSNYIYNFIMLGMDEGLGQLPVLWKEIVYHQFPLLFGSIIGFVLLGVECVRARDEEKRFLLVVAFLSSLILLLGMYSQSYMVFLPLVSIVTAFGIMRIASLFGKIGVLHFFVFFSILFLFFTPMERYLIKRMEVIEIAPYTLNTQRFFTDFMLASTPRTEPVFLFWNLCSGYTFNSDVQYYWSYNVLHAKTAQAVEGYDVYGATLVQALREQKIKYIIAEPQELGILLSYQTRAYIQSHYKRLNNCILERK